MDESSEPLERTQQNSTRAQTAAQRASVPPRFHDRYGRSISQALQGSSSSDDGAMRLGSLGALLQDTPETRDSTPRRRRPPRMVEAEPDLPDGEEASDGSGGAAGEVEEDSSSSSMTYDSSDSSDELSFTGGCD